MIRLIFVAIFLLLFFIASILLFLIEWIIGKFNMDLRDRSSLAIVQWALRTILFLSGTRVTVTGMDNIPKDKAVLYVGNHTSYFDIVVGYTLVQGLTGFVSKKEMEKFPFINQWMRFLHCLFLDRSNIREGLKTILEGVELVKSGISVWIFPEGTRSKTGEMLPFKEGSLKIAQKTGCPIIPIGFKNTADIFENHFPFIKKTHVYINIGSPINVGELSKDEKKFLGTYTQQKVAELIR